MALNRHLNKRNINLNYLEELINATSTEISGYDFLLEYESEDISKTGYYIPKFGIPDTFDEEE